jgi:hypothetical protein
MAALDSSPLALGLSRPGDRVTLSPKLIILRHLYIPQHLDLAGQTALVLGRSRDRVGRQGQARLFLPGHGGNITRHGDGASPTGTQTVTINHSRGSVIQIYFMLEEHLPQICADGAFNRFSLGFDKGHRF